MALVVMTAVAGTQAYTAIMSDVLAGYNNGVSLCCNMLLSHILPVALLASHTSNLQT